MLYLIDSNIAIACDPLSHELEAGAESAMQFMRLVSTHHHDVRTHEGSLTDFARIKDPIKRRARLTIFDRYTLLASPPPISKAQADDLGRPEPGSNEEVDQLLLAAVVGDAAEYLVTQDDGLHKKARRMGVSERVLTLSGAVDMLRTLHADLPNPPPAVRRVKTHELDIDDTIFDGLKADYQYDVFVEWFKKAARGQRDALLIDGKFEHAAIAILKKEPNGEHGLIGPQLKVCTFKVADDYNGQKYGELLLKAIFDQAHTERYAGLYVTVLGKQEALITLLEDFGFCRLPDVRTPVGEFVFEKPLRPPNDDTLPPLEHHIRYGPPGLRLLADRCFAIPIEPRWHRLLFPDAEPEEDALFGATAGLKTQPFGNALRKAYLCNTQSRLLRPGDTLLFYRSSDEKAVYVVGTCEDTISSCDPAEIVAAVGRRTVYSLAEIEDKTRTGNVLVVMFRQDRILRTDPIPLRELIEGGVLNSWPQSVTKTQPEGTAWLAQRLGA